MTVQDEGRRRHRSAGVPRSGAMDWLAYARANALLGNAPGEAALECALGGLTIRFAAHASFAITGAAVDAELGGKLVANDCAISALPGEELTIKAIISGRFYYLGFGGGIDAPAVLGSRSTYSLGSFGGWHGRKIERTDTLPLGRGGTVTGKRETGFATESYRRERIRVLRCNQTALFAPHIWRTLMDGPFQIGAASDRTGYRIEGVRLSHDVAEQRSEPACPGAIQLPRDGQPIVLMADGPTIGGYPRIAVVITADLPALSQKRPGEGLSFAEATIDEAADALRSLAVART